MADLRSEIEARKSRIAELKRQREALAQNGLKFSSNSPPPQQSPQQLSLVTLSGPRIEIESPFLYTRSTQTDPIDFSTAQMVDSEVSNVASTGDQGGNDTIDQKADQSTGQSASNDPNTLSETVSATPATDNGFKIAESPTLPPSLIGFVENSWRAVARSTLNVPAVRDYTTVSSSGLNGSTSKTNQSLLHLLITLPSSASVTAWSPHFDDLVVTGCTDPRRAFVWSIDAPDRPEFTIRSPTPITTVLFSPHNAQYIYAGGANGQILAWDLKDRTQTAGARFDLLPQLRSPIDNSPILSLQFVGANLISLNEDGVINVWGSDVLSRPRHSITLEDKFRSILPSLKLTSAIVPTTMAIYSPPDAGYGLGYGTGTCVIGSIQGQLFRLPAMPTSPPRPFTWSHSAPISCLSFRHSAASPVSDNGRKHGSLLLSGGLDWKLRVWLVPNSESENPVELLCLNIDYAVSDVCWHPTIPSVFAAVGEDQAQVWNLDRSLVKPIYTSEFTGNINLVKFSGSKLSIASTPDSFGSSTTSPSSSDGFVSIFSIADEQIVEGTDRWLQENHKYMNI